MTETPYLTNRDGFPLELCPRCGGTGNLPHHRNVFGGQCFGCRGKKYAYPRGKAAALAVEYYEARTRALRTTLGAYLKVDPAYCGADITISAPLPAPAATIGTITTKAQPGDKIEVDGEWRTIAAIDVTERIVGIANIGRAVTVTLETIVTFTDGTTTRGYNVLVNRASSPALAELRDRLAGEARTAYEKKLARAAKKK